VGLEEDDSSKMVVEVGDAAKSIKGISVAESDEASAEFGDTGKTNECIKVLASGEASMEYGIWIQKRYSKNRFRQLKS